MHKVSIIIPVYNAEKVIERCIKSILNQSYKNFEIICMDDGSKDSSKDKLTSLSLIDNRVKVFSQTNSGPARARFNAITRATGEYLMFCDADDWYEPTMIKKMVQAIEENNVDIVMCDTNVIDLMDGNLQTVSQNVYEKIRLIGKHDINPDLIRQINVVLWNKIFRMELINKYHITYPTEYEHDDTIFFLKYMAIAKTYFGVNEILYNYVVGNPDSIMGNVYLKKNKGRELDFVKAFINLFEFLDEHKTNNEYNQFIIDKFLGHYNNYSKYLDRNEKEESFKILKSITEKYPIFKYYNSSELQCVAKSKNYKQYIKYLRTLNVSWVERIFSVKNDRKNYKVLRIFGIKIKFRRKKIKDENAIRPAFTKNNIPIVFSCDNKSVKILSVALLSLIEHSTTNMNYDLIILHQSITDSNQTVIKRMLDNYTNFSVRFYDVSGLINSFGVNEWFNANNNIIAYYKCIAPFILKNYDKFLCVDSDIIINNDIIPLYNKSFEGKTVIAVRDKYVSNISNDNDKALPGFLTYTKNVLGINYISKYFNSGVLLVNNRNILNSKYTYLFKNIGLRNNQYFQDQNIFNSLYSIDVKLIDDSFNLQLSSRYPDVKILNSVILHYCSKERPWNIKQSLTDYIWWEYARKSPYYEDILENYLSDEYGDQND